MGSIQPTVTGGFRRPGHQDAGQGRGRRAAWTSQGGRPRKEPTLPTPRCWAPQPTELRQKQFPSSKAPGRGALLWQPQQRNPHRHTVRCQPRTPSQCEPRSFGRVTESSPSAHQMHEPQPRAPPVGPLSERPGPLGPSQLPPFHSFLSGCRPKRRHDAL